MTMSHEPTSPTIVAPQVLLGNHLKALKLPTFAREYEKVAMESARDSADYPRYLLRLCELEHGAQANRRNVTGEIVAKCRRCCMMTKDRHGFLATIKCGSKLFGQLPRHRGDINQSGLQRVSNHIKRRKTRIIEMHLLGNG
jgi:hypothetical protein